jgi:hypothetical protein
LTAASAIAETRRLNSLGSAHLAFDAGRDTGYRDSKHGKVLANCKRALTGREKCGSRLTKTRWYPAREE